MMWNEHHTHQINNDVRTRAAYDSVRFIHAQSGMVTIVDVRLSRAQSDERRQRP